MMRLIECNHGMNRGRSNGAGTKASSETRMEVRKCKAWWLFSTKVWSNITKTWETRWNSKGYGIGLKLPRLSVKQAFLSSQMNSSSPSSIPSPNDWATDARKGPRNSKYYTSGQPFRRRIKSQCDNVIERLATANLAKICLCAVQADKDWQAQMRTMWSQVGLQIFNTLAHSFSISFLPSILCQSSSILWSP